MEINYKIIRSSRSTIALEISQEGALVVRTPYRASEGYINALLREKSNWINKKITEALQKKNSFRRKEFIDGEKFLYLGNTYSLRIANESNLSINGKGEILLPKSIIPLARPYMIKWYIRSAREIITERTDIYAKRLNLKYGKIKISSANTRWGSCSGKNDLNFTWRLIMAPLEIIDYVIIHEITHIVEKNHSSDFWNKVSHIIPDFKKRRQWLHANGFLLNV